MSENPTDHTGTTDDDRTATTATTATGSISGKVSDPDGEGIEGAYVYVSDASSGTLVDLEITDANGNYTSSGLAAGDYDVEAKKAGFEPVERTNVEVQGGTTTRVDITLPLALRKVIGDIEEPYGFGMLARNTATSGWNIGLKAVTDSTSAFSVAVAAIAENEGGGVRASTEGVGADGVSGLSLASSGTGMGVSGTTRSTDSEAAGVYGRASAESGTAIGVRGLTESPDGYGVFSDGAFRVTAPVAGNAFGNPSVHVARVENTADDTSGVDASNANALAIQAGPGSAPPKEVNYVSFYDGDGGSIGAIEGNGSGGVRYKNTGSDFAEYLPKRDPDRTFEAGEVVGVSGGELVADAAGADRAMVVSDQQIVLGNDPGDDAAGHEPVAFTGQVPVRVRGPVHAGDLVVPAGEADGTGRAVAPAEWTPRDRPIVGQAWERDAGAGVAEVTVCVGVADPSVLGEHLADVRSENERLREAAAGREKRIDELEAENRRLRDRLEAVERRLAGLETGSTPRA